MSAPIKRIPIKLGDGTKKRFLKFTFRAIARMEEELGESLEITLRRAAQLSARAVSGLVWAGLLHEEPEMTREKVIDLIPLGQIKPIVETVTQAISTAMGQAPDPDGKEDGAEGNAPAAEQESA